MGRDRVRQFFHQLAELVDLGGERLGRGAAPVRRGRDLAFQRDDAAVEFRHLASDVGGATRKVRDLAADVGAVALAPGDRIDHHQRGQRGDGDDRGLHAGEAEREPGHDADGAGDQRHAERNENGAQAPHVRLQGREARESRALPASITLHERRFSCKRIVIRPCGWLVEPKLRRPVSLKGAGCPLSVSAPGKKRGEQSADRRWCGSAAPDGPSRERTHLRIAGDDRPMTRAGAPLGALLRRSPSGAGPRFQQRAFALPSASSWQEAVVPPGGAPTPPECALCVSTPAGAAPAKARNCRAPATEGARLFSGASPIRPASRRLMKRPSDGRGADYID